MAISKKPQCDGTITNAQGEKVRCRLDGVAVWVIGTFGRMPKCLCGMCITRAQQLGWTVQYQISPEGSNVAG